MSVQIDECETTQGETSEATAQATAAPEPGLYPNVPAADYHGWHLASSHRLGLLSRSPAHMRHALDNPTEQTPAMALGEAAHLCLLQPHLFVTRFAVAPQLDRRTNYGKEMWQAFLEQHPNATPIKAAEGEACLAMARAVRAHPAASALLRDAAQDGIEVSGVWRCDATGVMCKMRPDVVNFKHEVLVDLKTCEDASQAAFERSIFNFGYARQAAHYMRGAAANGIGVDGFVFIAVEKQAPHAIAVYRLDDEVIAQADEEVVRLLELYGRCEREGRWPGYSDEVENIRIPKWALAQMNG